MLSLVVKLVIISWPFIVTLSKYTFLLNFMVTGTLEELVTDPPAGIIEAICGFWLSIIISALNTLLIKIPLSFFALISKVYSPGFISLGKVNCNIFPRVPVKSGIIAISVPFNKNLALVTMAFSKNSISMAGFFEFV